MERLLSISADAKTVKGEKEGYMTGILYLAPHTLSGYEVCPKSTEGCRKACLFYAGRGVYLNTQNARIRKTQMFFEEREAFMTMLYNNIAALVRKAKREGFKPAVRLNGTSDIAWEKISFTINGVKYRNMMAAFPDVIFYDYCKYFRKSVKNYPNYHLTFSLSESNDSDALKALADGMNVAVVVSTKRTEIKPSTWGGYPAIDGDINDTRFLDAAGHVILLTAKGTARKDTSGFVRDVNGGFMKL